MTIYEESEIMAIKRIEVALRNADMGLLKEASYKLHERYHNGCSFELLNELGQILDYVRENDIPKDIQDILCPTIEEILSKATAPNNIQVQQEEISAQNNADEEYYNPPSFKADDTAQRQEIQETAQQQIFQEQPQEEPEIKAEDTYQAPQSAESEKVPQTTPSIAVFYGTKNDLDYAQLRNYKNCLNTMLLSQGKEQDYGILNILPYLTDEEENIETLEEILSFFEKTSAYPLSIITTSQTSNLAEYLSYKNMEFYIPGTQMQQKGCCVLPLLGLNNIFTCTTCGGKTLSGNSDIKILCAKCPDCGGVALPDIQGNIYDNPKIWQRAFCEMVQAKIWILINPPYNKNEEDVLIFLQNSCEIAHLEEAHIITDNKDTAVIYEKMINTLNPACVCHKKPMSQRSGVSA